MHPVTYLILTPAVFSNPNQKYDNEFYFKHAE